VAGAGLSVAGPSGQAPAVDWIDFLGMQRSADPLRWVLPVTDAVTGGAGQLFGGCGFGGAAALLEELTGKPVAWATAQFLSNAFPPEELHLQADVPVEGHNFSQARVVGKVGDREVFTVLAALGTKRFDGSGRWRSMPDVPAPQQCSPSTVFGPRPGGLSRRLERRVAAGPWGIEEGWWREAPVTREYWDVELAAGGLWRLFRDAASGGWFADGAYD